VGTDSQGQNRGFTLDSLLKLHEAKGFDKKTTILHYLVGVRSWGWWWW
jgi:hypothetical protein